MKRKLLITVLSVLLFSCAHAPSNRKATYMKMPAGANVPSAGLAMDVSYDAKYDNLIPGYKILSVAITNNSIDIIQMDRASDKWLITDYKGKEHVVVTNLKEKDPKTYIKLSDKLRRAVQYPVLIQVADTKVIDLLVKDTVNLDGFRSVKLSSQAMGKAIEIIAQD